jgi:CubicO group peptidase (beta-lactamase class C family)
MASKTSHLLARTRLLAIIMCCLTASCASPDKTVDYPDKTVDEPDKTDDYIDRVMTERKIPGLQLAVVRSGKIVKTGSYGLSNLQDSVRVTSETLFPINSMTKAFTGVAIMQLAQDGKLSIDDTIGSHLAELPPQWRKLTIRQLMSHTSGLPDILRGSAKLIIADDAEESWSAVLSLPMQFEADNRFSYNQTGYILLGKLIDKLSEQPFTQFITGQQLLPLKMTGTAEAGFDYYDYVVPHQARQYVFDGSGRLRTLHVEFAPFLRTAAGMTSNATELATFAVALQQGKLLNPSSLKAMWTATTLSNGKTAGFNDLENGYALGWQVIGRDELPAVSSSGGNATSLVIYPQDDLIVVILTNLVGALPIQFADDIASFYFADSKLAVSASEGTVRTRP